MARIVLILLVFMVFSAGQVMAAGKVPPPVEVPPGASCKECGMKVKAGDNRFASEIIRVDGKQECFCDLGDLFVHYEFENKKEKFSAIYVKDFLSGAWVPAREAVYLTDTKVVTPMRYGIIAFKDRESAEKFKKEKGGGGIYTFDGVLASKVHRR